MFKQKQQLKGWQKAKLDELGTVDRGRSRHRPRNDVSLYGGDYPFIQTGDVKEANFWVNKYSQTYNKKGLAQSKLWPKNTLCITIAANIAETAILKFPACFPDSIIGFIPYEKVSDVKFIKYLIDTLKINMQAISKGTAQDNLSAEKLLSFYFYVPGFKIQQKISSVLSAYDELIENNTKRIKVLEELAQAVYNEWFIKFRFPGHEKVKMIDSGTEFGKIPEGWEVRNILDVGYFKFCKSKIKEFEGKKEYLATANIDRINIVKAGEMVEFNNKPSRAQIQPKLNTVWFARMKDTYKVLIYRKINQDMCNKQILSSGMVGFESEEQYFGFMYYTINFDWFHKLKDQHASGSTQISLTNAGLAKINIIVPNKELVVKYSEITNKLIDKIILLQKTNQSLRQTRDLLLPKLIGGEVGVK